MGQAQINVRTRACSRTSIARTKQAALTHNVRGKELTYSTIPVVIPGSSLRDFFKCPSVTFLNHPKLFLKTSTSCFSS